MSQQDNNQMQQHFYRASAADYGKIPGSPIAYWFEYVEVFEKNALSQHVQSGGRCKTHNDELYVRFFWEVNDHDEKWIPYEKGGEFRRWYGNVITKINWSPDAKEFYRSNGGITQPQFWGKYAVTWSAITSSINSFRLKEKNAQYSSGSPCLFLHDLKCDLEVDCYFNLVGFLNSKVARLLLGLVSPTINANPGEIMSLPYQDKIIDVEGIKTIVSYAKSDWDAYEISPAFAQLPLLNQAPRLPVLATNYLLLRGEWQASTLEMQRLEEENNKIFIEAYGLQDELTPDVPLSEITLTCNPHYRYGGNLTDEEREARLQSDTIAELISYAIGCMMGRYSLDREGLVYAHAGNEGFKALVEEGAYATFAADDDGILPLTSENWFSDDVAARIEQFVSAVWGKETLEENLNFIADSLTLYAVKPAKKGGETARETLRRYLSTQFYKDHLKTYKKRPIYWLFSSGKEKAFECLVYLHRYRESTLPRMRTEYVTPLLGQMAGRIERLRLQQTEASTAEAKRIGKEIDSLTKQLSELRAFDDQLKHHADMRITLDLDDGVKVNCGKFGTLLSDVKAITGDKGE